MPAKTTPKKPTTRKRTTARRKKLGARKPIARTPKGGSPIDRLGVWMAIRIATHAQEHMATTVSRKDAAILRITHEGCPTCHGNGQIFTKGKDGSFTGSKPCPAKPRTQKVSRLKVAMAARFGTDRSTGLIGWTCPCGSKEKPRYRDAKLATKALRAHETKKHGGQSVGGAWYAQVTEEAATQPAGPTPVSKPAVGTGKTDKEWEAQNKPMHPAAATKKGYCWKCAGNGALYSAFGGEQITVVCDLCQGSGKATEKVA